MELQLEESVGITGKMPDGLISCPRRPREKPIVCQAVGLQANQKQPSRGRERGPGFVHLIPLEDLYPMVNNIMENT